MSKKAKTPSHGRLLYFGGADCPKGFENVIVDPEKLPLPFKANSVHICLVPHVVEHIKPWLILPFFNELHRIIKPNGQLAVSTPYAGSPAWWGDPTHCTGFNERSFHYLSPEHTSYNPKKAKPWTIERGNPTYQVNGNLECVLRPIK